MRSLTQIAVRPLKGLTLLFRSVLAGVVVVVCFSSFKASHSKNPRYALALMNVFFAPSIPQFKTKVQDSDICKRLLSKNTVLYDAKCLVSDAKRPKLRDRGPRKGLFSV